MKHLVVTSRFDPRFAVGACAIQFARDLRGQGFEVYVLCCDAPEAFKREFPISVKFNWAPYSVQQILLFFYLSLTRSKFDKIHSIDVPTLRSDTLHVHSDVWDRTKRPATRKLAMFPRVAARYLLKTSIRLTSSKTLIVVPSTSLRLRICRRIGARARFVILPNVLLEDDPLFLRMLDTYHRTTNSLGFVAHGDLEYKGIEKVLQVIKTDFPGMKLSWAGGNESRSYNNSLEVMGPLQREQYSQWLSRQRGVIVASTYESFSMVALESIALGVPTLFLGQIGFSEFAGPTNLLFSAAEKRDFVNIVKNNVINEPQRGLIDGVKAKRQIALDEIRESFYV